LVKRKKPANVAESVRQQLLNRGKARGEDYNFTLSQYAIERFLYRLAESEHRQRFVLKGASLFCVWSQEPHRATWDLDLLGRGGGTISDVERAVRDICTTEVPDDGVIFDAESVRGEEIRPDEEYQGVRVRLTARLGEARVPVQVDVGFGDAMTPAPRLETYPTALEQPEPRVLAYSRETVIAEKLEALVSLGPRNSRMKDFYDLHFLAANFEFSGRVLSKAIRATFERRKTPIPDLTPFGLTEEFAAAPDRVTQWSALIRRGRLKQQVSLSRLLVVLRAFLVPILEALREEKPFAKAWPRGGPWE
jgi:predicted nucleotidyltransferase component of viral defense system